MKTTRQVIPDAPKLGPKFPCGVCGGEFETSEDFGNHFARVKGGTTIEGCAHTPQSVKKLRVKQDAA